MRCSGIFASAARCPRVLAPLNLAMDTTPSVTRVAAADAKRSQRGYGRQDFLGVAWHLDPSPLSYKSAVGVDQKGRSLDSPDLSAVHVLHLDHAELLAKLLVLVGDELEGKLHLGLEVLVRLQAVARNADDQRAGFLEFLVQVAELRALHRAPGRVVLGIEIKDYRPAAALRQLECPPGRGDGEIGDFLARHGVKPLGPDRRRPG